MKRRTSNKPTPDRRADFTQQWDTFCDVFYRVCYLSGTRFIRCFRSLIRFTRVLWRPIGHTLYRVLDRLVFRHYRRMRKEYHLLKVDVAKASDRVKDTGRSFAQKWLTLPFLAIRRHSGVFRTARRIATPLLALVLLAGTVLYWRQAEFALLWKQDGEEVGYITGEHAYNAALFQMEEADKLDSFQISRAPELSIRVSNKKELISEETIREAMLSHVSDTVKSASGLFVDGEFVGVMKRADLERLVAAIPREKEGGKADFFAKVEILDGLYPPSASTTEESIRKALDKVPIRNVIQKTSLETLPYTTVIEETTDQPLGYEYVKTNGRNGKHNVTVEIITVNGKEQYRSVVNTEVVQSPVNKVVVVGAQKYTEDAMAGDGKATGKFVWPLPYTKVISSPFASRWGAFHGAIDISNGSTNGKPIIASDGGTVIEAEYHGSYGYYVLIDHGNGYQTRYAHCSKLMVAEGQKVAQGEYIANVGNTGYSLGAHLHFEIIKNGQLVDPMNYVKR